ncbi:MAG: cell division/cell wall cluster transcriptional repressor MraZ [Bacteroidaceae bacterium]|nr:cell division/cell wall cluster transcriptional repressor MraZ [Bacteroidaceae bacterium]
MKFIGTIGAKVDNKGRIFLPAMFRKVLLQNMQGHTSSPQSNDSSNLKGESTGGELSLIMRKDLFEDCLVLYTEETWTQRMNELTSRLSVWSRRDQALKRRFSADAEWLNLDSNGRILLPKRYLQMAGIEGEVTFIGMDDTIEIWATSKLKEHQDSGDYVAEIEQVMTHNSGE